MVIINEKFKNRKVSEIKLIEYGFKLENVLYVYEEFLSNKMFKIIVTYDGNKMISKLIDLEVNEEYILVDVDLSVGDFVGKIKNEYETKIDDIVSKCLIFDAFKSKQSKKVIEYVRNNYQEELEYLWTNSNNAVFRHKENKKWYAALLIIEESKLGLDSNNLIEILDLRGTKPFIAEIVDNKNYFPGYHMNKQTWFTIKMDGSIPIEKIYEYIDQSYNLK